jgi:hypothetical protein
VKLARTFKPLTDSALIVDLQRAIVAVGFKTGIGDIGSEIGIRDVVW